MDIVIYILAILSVIGTHVPRIKSKHWVIRDQLNFRAVYLGLNVILLIVALFVFPPSVPAYIISILLLFSIFTCLKSVIPFTRLHRKTVPDIGIANEERQVHILISNVYQYNEDFGKLTDLIERIRPDIVFLLETDGKWDKATLKVQDSYPHVIKEIKDDTYGLIYMCRKETESLEINYLTSRELPSVETVFRIGGRKVRLLGIHPKPPVPGETKTSAIKDHEILKAGDKLLNAPSDEAGIIIGDLNDVAWSHTSIELKARTNLEDPRVGRGFYSTFPVWFPIRFPLDHVFCSPDFELVSFELKEDVGSDHFPVSVVFQIKPR